MLDNVRADFINLIRKLSEKKQCKNYSGTGLVLYDSLEILSEYHCNLAHNTEMIPRLNIHEKDFFNYLVEISDYYHLYHDGFHFISCDGDLTHVAQFFSPPIIKSIPIIPGQGARTFCAQCGSNIDGVLLVGSVSSKGNIYLFENGVSIENKTTHAQSASSQDR